MTPEDRALLDRIPETEQAANAIPRVEDEDRESAVALVREVLGELLVEDGIRVSPLGPSWSTDVDIYLKTMPDRDSLVADGWVPLDPVLEHIGSPDAGRWAITDGTRVLAGADLHLVRPFDAVDGIVARCKRRREVRAREVLELRVLKRQGRALPRNDVITTAARIESGLGGDELAEFAIGPPLPAPSPLPGTALVSLASRLKPRRRKKFVIALSGVDGAGKSTVARSLHRDLIQAGLPATIVWTRPGLGLRWLERLAKAGKRLLRQEAAPGIRTVARGEQTRPLRSRRGAIGWLWSVLVTFSFVIGVRRAHSRASAVAIYDRHLLDALATLEFAYEGVNLALQRGLVRSFLPRANRTVYLDIGVEDAVGRKPGDVFGEHAVATQLGVYRRLLSDLPEAVSLDATQPPERLARNVLRAAVNEVDVRR